MELENIPDWTTTIQGHRAHVLKLQIPFLKIGAKIVIKYKPGQVLRKITAALLLGTLSKPRRLRQRECGKTIDLIDRTIAQHVRFKTLCIS